MGEHKFNPTVEALLRCEKINFNAPLYPDFEKPTGWLCNRHLNRECHALFYYSITARYAWEKCVRGDAIIYEGAPDPQVNFETLIKSIAFLYNVKLTEMVQHWPCVSMLHHDLKIPILPDEERFRFTNAARLEIN